MIFFKYQRPDNLSFATLRHGEVFFASPEELNDAHEFKPHYVLNGNKILWGRLIDQIFLRVASVNGYYFQRRQDIFAEFMKLIEPTTNYLNKILQNKDVELGLAAESIVMAMTKVCENNANLNNKILDIPNIVTDFFENYIPKCLKEDRYIASFSLNALNPAMWGLYADAEKGFATIFVSREASIMVASGMEIFCPTGSPDDYHYIEEFRPYRQAVVELNSVMYKSRRPKINAFHKLISKLGMQTELEEKFDVLAEYAPYKQDMQLGLIKYSGWRFEREIRAILPTVYFLPPDARSLRLARDYIKGVIFGPAMSPADKRRVIYACYILNQSLYSKRHDNFMFFQAKHRPEAFELQIKPVGILNRGYSALKKVEELSSSEAEELARMAEEIQICAS